MAEEREVGGGWCAAPTSSARPLVDFTALCTDRLAGVLGEGVAQVAAALAALEGLVPLGQGDALPSADRVRDEITAVVALPVGWALVAAVNVLTSMTHVLSAAELTVTAQAWDRAGRHCAGGRLSVVADLDAAMAMQKPSARQGSLAAAGRELAPALGSGLRSGSTMVGLARQALLHPVAADGVLTQAHLEVLVSVTRGMSAEHRCEVEAEAVRYAPGRTRSQVKDHLALLAARLDPAWASRQVRAGTAERDVQLSPSSKAGCLRLSADLPLLHALAAWHALNDTAVGARDRGVRPDGTPEDRTVGQLRADALVGQLTGVTAELLNEQVRRAVAEQLAAFVAEAMAGATAGAAAAGAGAGVASHAGWTATDLADLLARWKPSTAVPVPVPIPDDFARLAEVGVVAPGDLEDGSDGDGAGSGGDAPPGAPRDGGPSGDHAPPDADALDTLPPDPLRNWQPPLPVPVPPDLLDRARVSVVVAAATLTGRSDHPAHAPGAGAVDVRTVRDLAHRAWYRWLLVDPTTGHLTHRDPGRHPPPGGAGAAEGGWDGPHPPRAPALPSAISAALRSPGYRPGSLLRAHVQVRDATCIGPTCNDSAHGTQLDHTIEYGERGPDERLGETTADNLGAGCRAIHQAKTLGGWRLTQPTPGEFVWRTRLGFTHHRLAQPVLPGWRHLSVEMR